MTTLADVMRTLKALWPNYSAEAAAVDAKILADVPADELLAAVLRYRETDESGFPPAPAKLRALCGRSKGIEARKAWEHVRSLPRCPASNSVERYTEQGKATEAAWKTAYADPRVRAGLRAVDRFGGLHGLLAGDAENARKAFCGAFAAEAEKSAQEIPAQAPAALLGFARAAR